MHTPLLIYTEKDLLSTTPRNEALNALIFALKASRSSICASVLKVV